MVAINYRNCFNILPQTLVTITGNSFYGYSIMNKARHTDVKIVDAATASDLINSPRFSTLDELSDTCFDVVI